MSNNELTHYGVLGMKWGVRRTPAQLGRSSGSTKKSSTKKTPSMVERLKKRKKEKAKQAEVQAVKNKKLSEMTDAELRQRIARLEMEKRYKDLNPPKVSFGKKIVRDVIEPSAKDAGKRVLTDWLTKKGKEKFGLNVEQVKDPISELQKEVKKLSLEKQYRNLSAEAKAYADSQKPKSKSSDNDTSKSKIADDLWTTPISQAETRQYIALGERRIAGLLPERSSASQSR